MREAVRIQMRGVLLNKKSIYNRCKLTRLLVDSDFLDAKRGAKKGRQGVDKMGR